MVSLRKRAKHNGLEYARYNSYLAGFFLNYLQTARMVWPV